MKAVSLFSGAGGMDIGFRDAGYKILVANEKDKYACETFRANHPEVLLLDGELGQHLDDLAEFSGVDVVFGGPPCQGFSVAGKMAADDPRSDLVFSFCAVVERLKPQAFVMENVKALGRLAKFERVRMDLMARFQNAGYSVTVHILNAKDFGVPQARERVFFIGVRKNFLPVFASAFVSQRKIAPSLREVMLPLGEPGTLNNLRVCNAKVTLAAKPVLRKSPYAGMLFNGQGRPLNPDGWASTLPASMGGNRTPIIDNNHLYKGERPWVEDYHRHLVNGGKPQGMHEAPAYLRRLTIDEAAVLQGFPSEYVFCGPSSKVYSQIGNAVPCPLAQAVANAVRASLQGEAEHYVDAPKGQTIELYLA